MTHDSPLLAAAAQRTLPVPTGVFLHGYPFVRRFSASVNDPLLCNVLCVACDDHVIVFASVDLIFVSKAMTGDIRRRLPETVHGLPLILLVGATHTHSGPVTMDYLSNSADPVVPKVDPVLMASLAGSIAEAIREALAQLAPACLQSVVAQVSGIGTNRHDPQGPRDPDVPLLLARSPEGVPIGALWIVGMHPTVLREDSSVISADFPGFARTRFVTRLGRAIPVCHFSGAAGDQSPRHVISANTLEECRRIGSLLGDQLFDSLAASRTLANAATLLRHGTASVADLPIRSFPPVNEAEMLAETSLKRLEGLRQAGSPRVAIRTAECDWFGATETLTLARHASTGAVIAAAQSCLPAEMHAIRIGNIMLLTWPGEAFVEYALELRKRRPGTYLMTLVNGDLQGYIVTAEAVRNGVYESGNALFGSPESGEILLQHSLELIDLLSAGDAR